VDGHAADGRDGGTPPRRRRARYRGRYPRRFHEKYKEHAPQRYPELIEHVRERGRTPAGQHVPILVEEVLAALAPAPGERGVDATLGWGGHAQRILERLAPRAADGGSAGSLLALDADPLELERTTRRLADAGFGPPRLLVRRTNFAALGAALHEVGWGEGVDFVLADLGVSSMQIDDPSRGFSFRIEGPLDMRMNPARGTSAAQWLQRVPRAELARVLDENADEPHARRLATALAPVGPRPLLETTRELADAVRAALAGGVGEESVERSVRRVFQALRIEVNDEFGALEALLRQLPGCLRAGGRAVFLTFHSGEDRRVKRAFERGLSQGAYASIGEEVVRASPAERRANPRSTSAKLRCAVRGR
jgi:16S rRNA (cytosine1402-N4)-methyltransferase